MKKFAALLLALLLAFNLSVVGFAKGEENQSPEIAFDFENAKTDYPYIYVHGIGGWGEKTWQYSLFPYWGGGLRIDGRTDFLEIFKDNGLKIYGADVGPFSSAWDNACELYAQLTGTVVDYGEAHSKAHNHDRYGFSYENKPLMERPWNPQDKINLIGYSFGGASARLFTSLLKYGNEAEIKATGESTSELFKGGYGSIHSCVTFSAPHNGTQVADMLYGIKGVMPLISTLIHLVGTTIGDNFILFTFQLGHFGLTAKQNEKRAKFSWSAIKNFAFADDNCAYDLTIKGAEELNREIKLSPDTYYYSYSTYSTEKDPETGIQKGYDGQYFVFGPTTLMIALSKGKTFSGHIMKD